MEPSIIQIDGYSKGQVEGRLRQDKEKWGTKKWKDQKGRIINTLDYAIPYGN